MRMLLFMLTLSIGCCCYAQISIDTISRAKENASSPGHYEVVAMINKSKIDLGDSAIIEVYITGYGQIKQAKLLFSTSTSNIFDELYVTHGLEKVGSSIYWGNMRHDFERLPATMLINGHLRYTQENGNVKRADLFSDIDTTQYNTSILMETGIENAPIGVHFKIRDDARPDDYKFNLNLTYFNGNEWSSSIVSIDFRANNWIQKNEVPLGILAALAAIIALLPGLKILWLLMKRLIPKKKETVKRKR